MEPRFWVERRDLVPRGPDGKTDAPSNLGMQRVHASFLTPFRPGALRAEAKP